MTLITFDFHNTIASCDAWFELEIRTITSQVANRLQLELDEIALDSRYRELRQNVMHTGVEISAADAVSRILAEFDRPIDRDLVEQTVDSLMKESMNDLEAKPGAIETISFLAAQGHTLGVISSAAHHDFVEWSLARFGVRHHFAFVLTSVRAGIYKSNPAIYERALSEGNGVASRSLHIGDSIKWDVESAARAGMNTGWIVSPQRFSSETKPNLVFDSLHDAGPLIDRFVRTLA